MANTTGKKFGGRTKGTPNKLTESAKEAFEIAYSKLQENDETSLFGWAEKNLTDFYKLYSKLIPTDIKAKVDTTVQQFDLKDTIKQFYEGNTETETSASETN